MVAPTKARLLKILLADDGTLNMRPAVQLLADLPHERDSVITSLRVFTPLEGSEFSRVEAESEKTNNLLKSRHFHYQSILVQGYPAETILKYARENSPDLIVMGGKAAGTLGGLLGNVAVNVLHSGNWPVLIVRGPYEGLKHVLLVTDGSHAGQHTSEFFAGFPLPAETSVEIMHVVMPVKNTFAAEPGGVAVPTFSPEEEARINRENMLLGQDLLEKTLAELGWPGNSKLILKMGDPLSLILEHIRSEKIDMLVCGCRGSGNLTGWLLGSISRELVRQAACSVLVVRSPAEKDQ
ncbi:MAG TPA: universal stress protein [Anaerolineales bacterium]|jgi:nucleotide-binding universal stress UspA family protein